MRNIELLIIHIFMRIIELLLIHVFMLINNYCLLCLIIQRIMREK